MSRQVSRNQFVGGVFFMKKALFALFIAIAATGTVSAQSWGPGWGPSNPGSVAQSVTVTGTLQLLNGTIAVTSNNSVYYVPSLERFIGFIGGLKEGTQVNVEAYVYGNQAYTYLQLSKLTINGKTYDFPVNDFAQGPRNGYRQNNYRGHGGPCCW
jgi:hypothetical protein